MKLQTIKSDLLLLITAILWGFAFVAQRAGMEYIGPFLFNGIRFALGSLILLPIISMLKIKGERKKHPNESKFNFIGGISAGLILFLAASLQQIGVKYTVAGKAGFITGLYVILVPILGIFLKHKLSRNTWSGAILATVGLYFLSVTTKFTICFGDFMVFLGAIFWAVHVHIIGNFSAKVSSVKLASIQFAICSLLSLVFAIIFEEIRISAILNAAIPILYGGIISVGIAYTLQIIAQKEAPPAHAAILMSLEGVFAVLGGWLILAEILSLRALFGCTLMLTGMIFSQLNRKSVLLDK